MKYPLFIVYQSFAIPRFFHIALLSTFCFLVSAHAQAQIDEPPKDVAPPPLRMISKDERKILDGESNPKKRTELSLTLMEARIKKSEDFVAQNSFQESINELGGFQVLLEDVLNYLTRKDDGGGKADNNFKRLEIGLRKVGTRIELVRREMPYRYGYYVLRLQKYVRDARARAIEPLFDDSVVIQKKIENQR